MANVAVTFLQFRAVRSVSRCTAKFRLTVFSRVNPQNFAPTPLSPAAKEHYKGYILRNSPDSAADDFLDLGMFQHDFLKEFNDF